MNNEMHDELSIVKRITHYAIINKSTISKIYDVMNNFGEFWNLSGGTGKVRIDAEDIVRIYVLVSFLHTIGFILRHGLSNSPLLGMLVMMVFFVFGAVADLVLWLCFRWLFAHAVSKIAYSNERTQNVRISDAFYFIAGVGGFLIFFPVRFVALFVICLFIGIGAWVMYSGLRNVVLTSRLKSVVICILSIGALILMGIGETLIWFRLVQEMFV